ncbi:unnamed protein product [Urochloa humidicola]
MQQMALPIAELVLPSLVLLIPLYLYIKLRRSKNASLPTDWPILGVLPCIAANRHSFHDFVTSVLAATNLNFRAYGPPGTSMRFFLTCDPENVRHILTKNFANYPKGGDFSSMFGGLLEGTIFTTDGESWRQQRTRIHHVLSRPSLLDSMSRGCRDKVARGLVPLLSRMAVAGAPFDMDDVLGRLVFDTTVMLIFGEDPHCLSAGKPAMPVAAAMDALMEVAFFRHTVPTACWKLMRRLRIGPERNAASAEAVLWDFVAEKIRRRVAGSRRADGEAAAMHVDDTSCTITSMIRTTSTARPGSPPASCSGRSSTSWWRCVIPSVRPCRGSCTTSPRIRESCPLSGRSLPPSPPHDGGHRPRPATTAGRSSSSRRS